MLYTPVCYNRLNDLVTFDTTEKNRLTSPIGVGSAMCSYNRINNSYACQNSAVMNGLLKTELGFEGVSGRYQI